MTRPPRSFLAPFAGALFAGALLLGCGGAATRSETLEGTLAAEVPPERVLALEWFEEAPRSWALRLAAGTEGLSGVVLEVPTAESGWAGVRSDAVVWSVDQPQGEGRLLGRFDRGWGSAALAVGTELARFNGAVPAAPTEVAIAASSRAFEIASIAGPRGSVWVAMAKLPEMPPVAGDPLSDLTREQLDAFEAGRREFDRFLTERDGLGPSFNGQSCFACHFGPASGGFSERRVVHFASSAAGGRSFPEFGGPVLQERGIHPAAEELIPPEADVQAIRISPHVFGSGLVDALEDATLSALAAAQPADVRGRVHWIPGSGGAARRAGRFGWKAQSADLLHFTAEAALEELGQTNRLFPEELHPGGDRRVTELYDRVPDPEIVPGADGRDRLDRLVDFQRWLAPPHQTPAAGHPGEVLFERTGCAECHTPRLVTGDGRRFAPYSDFLLHDLGDQADGIRTGAAGPSEMRTAPLWGLTGRRFLWHDGALALEPFDVLIEQAVARHAGQGAASRAAFGELTEAQQALLIDFLRSLGRAPHDLDADGQVTRADGTALIAAVETGGGGERAGHATWRELLDLDGDGCVGAAEWAACARSLAGAPQTRRELAEPRR